MESAAHSFGSLLHPISADGFFSDYWERKPLSIQRHDGGYYRGLLTNRDLEDLISNSDARYPAIRLAKDGSYYPPHAYTQDVQIGELKFAGVPDVGKIAAEYAKGATIALPALHRTWEPLSSLCGRIEEELDHAVHANVYITPGHAAGFTPHYDTHDVLVLQIAGNKRWRIDEPPIKLPHESQTFKPQGFVAGPHLTDIDLEAGDLLYLPRGYVHSTTTSRCHSAHVTIGINVYSWVDLVKELIPSCAENERLRKALPAGFASRAELRAPMREQLAQILAGLSASHDCDRLIDQFILRVTAARRRIPVRFRTDVAVISPDSLLQPPPEERYGLARNADHVVLNFEGKSYVFKAPIVPTFNAMCARSTFRIKDLPAGPGTEVMLHFARYLQSIGFLRPAG
jgi:ribosomal protein L16 Arg81 hydroxylase